MGAVNLSKGKNIIPVHKDCIFDLDLDNAALGLLVKLLACPDDFDFSIKELQKCCKDNISNISAQLSQLEEAGYFTRKLIISKVNGVETTHCEVAVFDQKVV